MSAFGFEPLLSLFLFLIGVPSLLIVISAARGKVFEIEMKTVWFNLLVSALTDALTAFVASILAVMSEVKDLPSKFSLMFAAGGAALIALRTIQQALKATPQITAALKGEEPPVVIPVRQAPAVLKPEVTEPHHLYGQ